MSVQEDRELIYEAAKQLVVDLEAAWEAENKPLLTEGGATGSALVPHPLVKMLAEARRDVDRFAKGVGARERRGRKPEAVVSAGVGKSPATRLRVAK